MIYDVYIDYLHKSVLNNRTLVHLKMMNHSYIYLFHSYKILDLETWNSYFCTKSFLFCLHRQMFKVIT